MIVLLRGTGGSGKTFIAERVIDRLGGLDAARTLHGGPQGKICGYVWDDRNMVVMGKYGIACGGCDTVGWKGGPDDLEALITQAASAGHSVLLEGIAVSSWGRERLKRMGLHGLTVIHVSTPIDLCIAAVRARREARGTTKPLDPTNTIRKYRALLTTSKNDKFAGIKVETLDRDAARERTMELLGL